MNGTQPEPLPADVLDELLSADLDGAFDDAARELGFDPATARARVAATAGSESRRAALANAQAAVASDRGDALDEVTRRRLVAHALESGPPVHHIAHHRARTWIVRAGAFAGAAAALIGIIVVLGHTGNTSSSKDSSAGVAAPGTPSTTVAPEAAAPSGAGAGNVSVDSPAQLRAFAIGLLQSNADLSQKTARAAGASTTANAPQEHYSAGQEDAITSSTAPVCASRVARSLNVTPSSLASAPARYRNQPVGVVVFQTASGPLAAVYDPARCTVLAHELAK
jgi:hypothetical protein